MKKIAIISTTFPPLSGGGGVASAHYNLYRQLRNHGYEVKVFTFNDDGTASDRNPSLTNDIIRFGLSTREIKRLNRYNYIRRKIDQWILKKPVDEELKFQHYLLQRASIAAKKINSLLIEYNPQIVFLPSNGVPGSSLIKISGARYFHICHHNAMQYIGNPLMIEHSLGDAQKAIAVEQKSLAKIDVVICVSNYMKSLFQQSLRFDKPIVVLPNIVDDTYIQSVERIDLHLLLGIDSSFPIVYIPAGGMKTKGAQFVVELIRRISKALNNQVGFYISGKLSTAQEFELSFLEQYHLHIFVAGDISNEQNLAQVKDCALCVSPTHTENYSMAFIEALFIGIPCVAFEIGGNADIVLNDKTGYLVPYCDMEQMIEKCVTILRSEELQKQLKVAITAFNKERSATEIASRYIKLIES
jgi:glycosyltransferase involved in cell wall biosynthesis